MSGSHSINSSAGSLRLDREVARQERLALVLPRVAAAASMMGLLTPFVVLLGWWLGMSSAGKSIPAITAMNPLSALCFMVAGAALWFRHHGVTPRQRELIPGLGALLIMIVAILRIAGYVEPHFDLGLDRFLFPERVG